MHIKSTLLCNSSQYMLEKHGCLGGSLVVIVNLEACTFRGETIKKPLVIIT